MKLHRALSTVTTRLPKTFSGPTTVIVMGVSGSGKSTVARALAERLGWAFGEGDDFHSAASVARMAAGQPLTDQDRRPWLEAIARWIGDQEEASRNAVITCSALKRSYRDLLRLDHPSVWFLHLAAPRQVVAARLADRVGHYMPPSLLDSQMADLQPLGDDEPGLTVDASGRLSVVVDRIIEQLP